MGSGSKKHKEKDREKKDKSHKKKKKHKRDRSGSRSPERKRRRSEEKQHIQEKFEEFAEFGVSHEEVPPFKEEKYDPEEFANKSSGGGGGGDVSLSIEETNRLRAQLGLKPLAVPDEKPAVDGGIPGLGDLPIAGGAEGGAEGGEDDIKPYTKKEDVHAPATNLAAIRQSEELRQKMALIREKRKINQKLGKVKTLGDDSDEDEGALAWVKKSRKLAREKEMADKRAAMMDEMDEEFGIGTLVEESFAPEKKKKYSSKDLRGLKVKHAEDSFVEGRDVILTLEDHGILDEEATDTLVNYNMLDDEKAYLNLERKKKKPDYNPYDEAHFDESGQLQEQSVLSKYDEEIDGRKISEFQLGAGGRYSAQHERQMRQFKANAANKTESLTLAAPVIASEYYTTTEMESFKKVKRKVRKVRKKPKMLKADDILPLGEEGEIGDLGSREKKTEASSIPGLDLVDKKDDIELDPDPLGYAEIMGPEQDLTGVHVDDDAANELQQTLNKARRLKQATVLQPDKDVLKRVQQLGSQPKSTADEDEDSMDTLPSGSGFNITMNATSEFCRSLGEIPTYGQAGNRAEEEKDELLDFERELQEERRRLNEEEHAGNWQSVEIDDKPVDIKDEEQPALEEEILLDSGIASALKVAQNKGYVEAESKKLTAGSSHNSEMMAKNYSIEDKRYDDLDEKYRKRDRFSGGMTMDFKEIDTYKPEVKLEYVDDGGRPLNAKEAFRQLSHRFHGKGSGKMKTEKRAKKQEQDNLLKCASSTDTPLGTVELLREKQKTEKTPYLILSGTNKTLTGGNVIAK